MFKLVLFFVLAISLSTKSNCQDLQFLNPRSVEGLSQTDSTITPGDEVFITVDKQPEFSKGNSEWASFIMHNLNPNVGKANGAPAGTYPVMIRFTVHKNGKADSFEAITAQGYGMEEEIINVAKSAHKKWIPAKVSGQPVTAYSYQNVTFYVN